MIATASFVSRKVLQKILDDTIPKLTCIIATPIIFILMYMFLVYWEGLHLLLLQMPFFTALPFMCAVVFVDYVMVERVSDEVAFMLGLDRQQDLKVAITLL